MLSNINWSFLDTDISINDAVTAFNANIISAFPSCCPTYKPNNSPPWSDSTLRSLKRDRNRTLRNYQDMRDPHHKRILKYASNAYRIYNRACFRSYFHECKHSLKFILKPFGDMLINVVNLMISHLICLLAISLHPVLTAAATF